MGITNYIIEHLDEALQQGWIQVYYQPVIRTLTGEVCGFEALARWIDPQVKFLPPNSFIPVLEQSRQIHKLDTFILHSVCQTLHERQEKGLPVVPVSFNLSRLDFEMTDIFAGIEETLREFDLTRDLLHVEITESLFAEDLGPIRKTSEALRQAGYQVWMDDFGSGYSSLNVLKDFSFDLIKLDMEFLRHFTENSRQIITSVVDMAKRLGLHTLAEGVETREQADFLFSIGCECLQGYLFDKPEPLEKAIACMQQQGRAWEERKNIHYYNAAGMAIHQTDSSLALVEFSGNREKTYHFLYANQAFREELISFGQHLHTIEQMINENKNRDARRLYEFFYNANLTGHKETEFFVSGTHYLRVQAQAVAKVENNTIFTTTVKNIQLDRDYREQDYLDNNLRRLYTLYNVIDLVDLEQETIETIYGHGRLAKYVDRRVRNLRQAQEVFCQHCIYYKDQARYRTFVRPETIKQRLAASEDGVLRNYFRTLSKPGEYRWQEHTIMLVPGSKQKQHLYLCKDALPDGVGPHLVACPDTVEAPSAREARLLWENQLAYSGFAFFWKDNKRRFLGASRSFLDYFGVTLQDILGKTDEDMGWHIDETPYREDEERILNEGVYIENSANQCIIRGVLHRITAFKHPVYDNGKIVGLAGMFFDVDQVTRTSKEISHAAYEDPVTNLMNRRGFLAALLSYQEQALLQKQPFTLIVLNNENYSRTISSYGRAISSELLQKEADCLRRVAGKNSVIARMSAGIFTVLHFSSRKDNEPLAFSLKKALEEIHEVKGNSVTLRIHLSLVDNEEADITAENIYRIALSRLS